MKKYLCIIGLCCLFGVSSIRSYSQTSAAKKDSTEKSWKVFGMIYGGFYDKMAEGSKPKSGFEVKTGIMGFKNQFSEKVDAIIMFDVSKTTRDIKSSSDSVSITYTEGNNYTAYLKQAEIHWKINKLAEVSAGMLLSSQFLLTQDKFWSHRYVEYTFQEVNKYGSPADFGVRLKLNPTSKISCTFNVLNGEGPARWQDDNSKFLFTGDVEYRNSDRTIFRIYGDYKQAPTAAQNAQTVVNAFIGVNYQKLKLGAEASFINNVGYADQNIYGSSVYAVYKILDKVEFLARYDNFQDIVLYDYNKWLLAGFQYEPAKNFFLSLNYRQFWPTTANQVYVNFGAKF